MCFIREPEVRRRTGFSPAQIDRLEALNQFPRRVPLGARAIGWVEKEVVEWQLRRIAMRDAAIKGEERPVERLPPAQRHRLREGQQREEADILTALQTAELPGRERTGNVWSDTPA